MEPEDDNIEVLKSNKGGMKIIYRGYMYTVHKRRQCGGIRWRCAQRSLHCKGSISTSETGLPKINMPHNHIPDLHSVALARGRQENEEVSEYSPEINQLLDLKMDEEPDSLPLLTRLEKATSSESGASGVISGLKSQALSPTKLKVTRREFAGPKEEPNYGHNEEMCLRWNSHHSNMQAAFPSILLKEQFVDVTLAAEGKTLKCHRMILSSCSPYFEDVLNGLASFQHPVLFMKDIPFTILKSLCDFMYAGEVHICQNRLEELLAVAEILKIKGLAGKTSPPVLSAPPPLAPVAPEIKPPKRQYIHRQLSDKHNIQSTSQKLPKTNRTYYERRRNNDANLMDPLDLLEPLYEESTIRDEKKPQINVINITTPNVISTRTTENVGLRVLKKRGRKRKNAEMQSAKPPQRDNQSPPPLVFTFRKGTRSRPNLKHPKIYDETEFHDPSSTTTLTDPLSDIPEIKSEPIELEDHLLETGGYITESSLYTSSPTAQLINPSNTIIITSSPPKLDPQPSAMITLSKPIITNIETVQETEPPIGGLEVIKIRVHEPEMMVEMPKIGDDDVHVMEEDEVVLVAPEEGILESDIVEGETVVGEATGSTETAANNNLVIEDLSQVSDLEEIILKDGDELSQGGDSETNESKGVDIEADKEPIKAILEGESCETEAIAENVEESAEITEEQAESVERSEEKIENDAIEKDGGEEGEVAVADDVILENDGGGVVDDVVLEESENDVIEKDGDQVVQVVEEREGRDEGAIEMVVGEKIVDGEEEKEETVLDNLNEEEKIEAELLEGEGGGGKVANVGEKGEEEEEVSNTEEGVADKDKPEWWELE